MREGKRLPASYVNFYIANKAVVVPQFNQPKWDEEAIRKLRSLFPEREIIGVQSRDILIGGGNIHCITQQVPLCTDTGTDSSVVWFHHYTVENLCSPLIEMCQRTWYWLLTMYANTISQLYASSQENCVQLPHRHHFWLKAIHGLININDWYSSIVWPLQMSMYTSPFFSSAGERKACLHIINCRGSEVKTITFPMGMAKNCTVNWH